MLQNDRFPDQVRILLFLWNIDPINFPTRSLGIFLFLFLIFFFFQLFILKQLQIYGKLQKCYREVCVPSILFPPVVTSDVTGVQYQNQEMDITVHRIHSDKNLKILLALIQVCLCVLPISFQQLLLSDCYQLYKWHFTWKRWHCEIM